MPVEVDLGSGSVASFLSIRFCDFAIRGWWALIASVFLLGVSVTAFQFKLNYKIEQLQVQNQNQHEMILLKLTEMDNQVKLYALKRQVEDTFVFVSKWRDDAIGRGTNNLVADEIAFRAKLRDFLK